MRARVLVGSVVLFGVLTAAALAKAPARQFAIVNLTKATLIGDTFVMGTVMFTHDDAKMARGEPCTEVYRFEPGKGPSELLVAFHCTPRARDAVDKFQLSVTTNVDGTCILREYQFAGDSEGHGVPSR